MIDTIVLRIHNLKKYPQIYEQYFNPSKKKGSFTTGLVDESTGELIETTFSPGIVFHDSNRILQPRHRSNIKLPSSHYDLAYCLDTQRDFLEFNFSIPKAIFATNVLQFIHEGDQSASMMYAKLMLYLHKFLQENFIQTPLLEDVEINRIDFCYNQVFNSKIDALSYLEEQKKMVIDTAISEKNRYNNYGTTIAYTTRRYSFKVYHKGTEFAKNDYKELVKNGNKTNIPLQEFLDESDKILRYELTFRSSYMSYLMQHYFFVSAKESLYPQYADHIVAKTFKQFVTLGYQKVYENYKRSGKFFTMKSVFDLTKDPKQLLHLLMNHNSSKAKVERRDYQVLDTVTFDQTMFTILYNTFWDKVKQYQLTKVMSISEMSERIEKIKDDAKFRKKNGLATGKDERNMDKTRLLVCGLLIQQNYNFSGLKKFIPKTTYYRLKNELKVLGITPKNTNCSVPLPRIDYRDYLIQFRKFHKY